MRHSCEVQRKQESLLLQTKKIPDNFFVPQKFQE